MLTLGERCLSLADPWLLQHDRAKCLCTHRVELLASKDWQDSKQPGTCVSQQLVQQSMIVLHAHPTMYSFSCLVEDLVICRCILLQGVSQLFYCQYVFGWVQNLAVTYC